MALIKRKKKEAKAELVLKVPDTAPVATAPLSRIDELIAMQKKLVVEIKQAQIEEENQKQAEAERLRVEEETKEQAKANAVKQAVEAVKEDSVKWEPPVLPKRKTDGKTACIVIVENNWYEKRLDLKGMNTRECEWGDYGVKKVVLVADKDGMLKPYLHSDIIGESTARLYKAANPEGFKEVFRHRQAFMEKLKIGLMVGLVIAIFVLIYVLINQKQAPPVENVPVPPTTQTAPTVMGLDMEAEL